MITREDELDLCEKLVASIDPVLDGHERQVVIAALGWLLAERAFEFAEDRSPAGIEKFACLLGVQLRRHMTEIAEHQSEDA